MLALEVHMDSLTDSFPFAAAQISPVVSPEFKTHLLWRRASGTRCQEPESSSREFSFWSIRCWNRKDPLVSVLNSKGRVPTALMEVVGGREEDLWMYKINVGAIIRVNQLERCFRTLIFREHTKREVNLLVIIRERNGNTSQASSLPHFSKEKLLGGGGIAPNSSLQVKWVGYFPQCQHF